MTSNNPDTLVKRDELLALAERCEQATGPDRELDVTIAVAVDWRWDDWEEGESTAAGQAEKHGLAWLLERSTHGIASMWRNIPNYTASLDAAMTLVPEPAWTRTDKWPDRHTASVQPIREPSVQSHTGTAATIALALCAASLRSLANKETEK